MRDVLAALDHAPGSRGVLRAAVDIGSAIGATISLMRVVEVAAKRAGSDEALLSRAKQQLTDLARAGAPGARRRILVSMGETWREICGTAHTTNADLVVLGTRRHSWLEGPLGTTARTVLSRCDRSTLVVRGWAGLPNRILVALDGQPHDADVRSAAMSLARPGAQIRLFRAFDMRSVAPADMLSPYRTDSETSHGALAWRKICTAARDYSADLIVVGARGCGSTDRLLDTTAGAVVEHAEASVLTVWLRSASGVS
jgi:nucleotide-binding universal stress UspA family protein